MDAIVTYDELRGRDLDAARWSLLSLPRPTGGEHIPLDPDAEVAVGEGEVRVTIPRFSLSDDAFQPADSAKYLMSARLRGAAGSIRDGRSRSLDGQGIDARWRRFRVRGVGA